MRIGIIGLGSIGQRHMRNLLEMGEQDLFAYDPRIGEQGFSCAPIQGTNSIDMLWNWKPDALLICSPPDTHYLFLSIAPLHHVKYVFVEKPLVHTWDHASAIAERNKGTCWQLTVAVGYQLRWQLGENMRLVNTPGNLIFECSQDMSQWPSQYQKDALLEFSHEIDTAIYLNGPAMRVSAIESIWGWHILLRHMRYHSEIFINPRANSYERKIYNGDNRQPVWMFSHEKNDEAYKQELRAFLSVCRGEPGDGRLCTLAQAAHVMKIIDACKRSAKNCEVVQL